MEGKQLTRDHRCGSLWLWALLTLVAWFSDLRAEQHEFTSIKPGFVDLLGDGGWLRGLLHYDALLLVSLLSLTAVLIWLWSLQKRVDRQNGDLVTQLAERERVERQLRQKTRQLSAIFAASPDLYLLFSPDGTILSVEGGRGTHYYLPYGELLGRDVREIPPSSVGGELKTAIEQVLASGQLMTIEYGLPVPNEERWYEARLLPFADKRLIAIIRDITRRKRAQDLGDAQRRILELITRGAAQAEILAELCRAMEQQSQQGAMASVFLATGNSQTLTLIASPNTPRAVIERFDGLAVGECPMSCGTVVYPGEPILVDDITASPLWSDYRQFALENCMRACWSMPVFSRSGKAIGTFAIAHPRACRPTEQDLEQLRTAAQLTSVTVEHCHAEQRLHQAATVFESTIEGVIIADKNANIIAVNKAFTRITGYTEDEVLGKNPRILQSGLHDWSFYTVLWTSVKEAGQWQGEIWNRRKNGEIYPQWLTISSVLEDTGAVSCYVCVFSDISSIKQSQERLNYLAHHDPLTGLPNRLLLNARLNHALQHAQRQSSRLAVLFLDLDQFKNINDTLGHPVGDELLRKVASRLSQCVRHGDTVARLGGDEFVVTMENLPHAESAAVVMRKILASLAKPFTLAGQEMFITASIGISLYPDDGTSVDELLRNADAAMYRAKEQGRNTYEFYTRELTTVALEKFTLETSLRYALERDEFLLYYQPQVSMRDGRIIGVEALIRWQHPELGLLSPARFIRLAEETGLINPIGEWVLHAACVQARAWQDQGLPSILMAVNLSGRQVTRGDLVGKVQRVLQTTGLEPRYLELEITEGSMMDQAHKASTNLDALKSLGVTLAIDDFGTGYSSMSYLKRFSVDKLKIDQSFVRDIVNDANDQAIIRAIIAMCDNLQLTVVAEGVETPEQRAFLHDHRCDEMQGYLFSPPVPAQVLATLLGKPAGGSALH